MAYEGLIPIEINEQVEGATTPITITSVTVGGLVDDGDHYYKMAYDFGGGVISSLSAVSLVATAGAGNNTVNLDDLPIGPINTVNRLLYRTKVGFADYYLVDTIAGNVTTSYIDIKADGALGALFVPTFKNGLSETADGDILIQSGAKILFSTSTVSQISFDDWFNQPLKTTSSPTFAGAMIEDATYSTYLSGKPAGSTGDSNVQLGRLALYSNVTGNNNTAVGSKALKLNVSGKYNSAFGVSANYNGLAATSNVAVGFDSLHTNTVGDANVAVGNDALYRTNPVNGIISNISDYSATVVGTVKVTTASPHGLSVGTTPFISIQLTNHTDYYGTVTYIDATSFYYTHSYTADETSGIWSKHFTGSFNTAIGMSAGQTLTYGYVNSFLGFSAGYNALQKVDAVNSTAIGANSYTTKDNQVVLGDANVTETVLRGRVLGNQGADIASANDMTLTVGNYFDITGSTEVQRILGTNWTAGTTVIIQFDAAPLVKHGTAAGASYYGFQLAGAADFQASAGDTLMLVFDGAWWREVARTVI